MRLLTIIFSLLLCFSSKSQIVINEIQTQPAGSTTASNPQNLVDCTPTQGAEYVELYNSDPCTPVDISCYILANNIAGTSAAAHGGFRFPAGTIVPPLGFVSIGGSNSGATFNLNTLCGTANLNINAAGRWYLPNGDGYMMLYDASGNVVDAIYWTLNPGEASKWGTDTDINTNPTRIPAGTASCPLVSSLSGPANLGIGLAEYIGQAPGSGFSSSRQTDGSTTWLRNVAGTINACNGSCNIASTFSITSTITNPTCGSSNGSASVTPNPAGAYTFTWTSPAVSSTNIATGLPAGNYTVTVGLGGCVNSTVISLINNGSPTITSTQTIAASCGSANGSATVTATAGSTYTWSPNGGNSSTTSGLSAGSYTVTAGISGCTTSSIVIIPNLNGPTIISVQTTSASCGNNDGTATITATPGSTYTWSPSGGLGSTATNLSAGDYTITVGLSGCTINTIITIYSQTCCPSSLTYSLSVAGNTVCNGTSNPCNYSGPSILINEIALVPTVNDGSIYGNTGLAGGKEGEWIELFNPDWCNSIDISGYILGSYNSTGNTLTTPYASDGMAFVLPQGTIVPPLGFVIVRGSNAPTPPSGVIDIVVNNTGGRLCIDGGITNSRLWFQNAGGWFAFYNSNGVMQDAVKWGAPTSTDLSGHPCLPTTNSVNIANIPLTSAAQGGTIVTTLSNTAPTTGKTFVRIPDGGSWSTTEASINTIGTCNVPGGCVNGGNGSSTCSGTAEITMTSGVAPYTYIWNDPLNQTSATSYSLCGGNYTVTVKDANQCIEIITVSVSTVITPTIVSVSSSSSTCSQNNGAASLTVTPSNATYSWSPNVSSSNSASNLPIGNYTVEAFQANCSTSTVITIDGTTLDITNSNKITPVSCQNNDGIVEILNITSSNGPHLINFNNNGFSSNTLFNNLSAGTYALTITDANNCSISEQINVTAEYAKPTILLPNVFTPNNDKVNDVWYPKLDCIETISINIFNRWGEKMTELNDLNEFWDGKSNGKDVSDGNYFFIFEAKSFAGETIKDKGTINLFR